MHLYMESFDVSVDKVTFNVLNLNKLRSGGKKTKQNHLGTRDAFYENTFPRPRGPFLCGRRSFCISLQPLLCLLSDASWHCTNFYQWAGFMKVTLVFVLWMNQISSASAALVWHHSNVWFGLFLLTPQEAWPFIDCGPATLNAKRSKRRFLGEKNTFPFWLQVTLQGSSGKINGHDEKLGLGEKKTKTFRMSCAQTTFNVLQALAAWNNLNSFYLCLVFCPLNATLCQPWAPPSRSFIY